VLTALGVLRMLPVLQRLGDAYGFWFRDVIDVSAVLLQNTFEMISSFTDA